MKSIQEAVMVKEWQELTRLTGGASITVERVRLADSGIAIEGQFSLPVLAQLPGEDQVFVMAFVGTHGSIKDMERLFGVSYPTVKARLDRLASVLRMVETAPEIRPEDDVLAALERGDIDVPQALKKIKEG